MQLQLTDSETLYQSLIDIPLVKRLFDYCQQDGLKLYLCGGAVRDFIMIGKPTKDLDFFVETPSRVLFDNLKDKLLKDIQLETIPIPFHLAGIDLIYSENVMINILQFDLTLNSILYDFQTKQFLDPTGGLVDLKNRVARINSMGFFISSPMCFVRIFKQAAKLNLTIEAETLEKLRQLTGTINITDHYRFSRCMFDMFDFFALAEIEVYFRQMIDTTILEHYLAELIPSKYVPFNKDYPFSLFDYNVQSVNNLEMIMRSLNDVTRESLMAVEPYKFEFQKFKTNNQHLKPAYNTLSTARMVTLMTNSGQAFLKLDTHIPEIFLSPSYLADCNQQLMTSLANRASHFNEVHTLLVQCGFLGNTISSFYQHIVNETRDDITLYWEKMLQDMTIAKYQKIILLSTLGYLYTHQQYQLNPNISENTFTQLQFLLESII